MASKRANDPLGTRRSAARTFFVPSLSPRVCRTALSPNGGSGSPGSPPNQSEGNPPTGSSAVLNLQLC